MRRAEHRREFLTRSLAAAAGAFASTGCQRSKPAINREMLHVATGADRYNLSPARFTFGTSRPNAHIAEAVVRPNASFEPVPHLFASWQHLGGGRFLARLRDGVRFHDGTPMLADVFIRSMKRFIANRDFVGLDSDSLQRVDERTIRFQSALNSARMIDNMTHPSAAIFLPNEDVAARPIGTGPYRLVRYEPQRSIEVERFAEYWGPKPGQQRIRFRFMPDPQARLLALQAGTVDVISDVTPELLLGLAPRDNGVTLRCSRPIRYAALTCNLKGRPPFDKLRDVQIRRALALSIDREAIAGAVFAGRGVVARGLMPGWMFGLEDRQPVGFKHDPTRANEILDQSGWLRGTDGLRRKNGEPLKLRLVSAYPNASSVRPIPEMLAGMFRRVGVDLKIVEVEDDQLYYSGYADDGQSDLFLELAANANADPTFLLSNLFHTRSPWRSSHFTAPGEDMDSLLDRARKAEDRSVSVDLVQQAHSRIIDVHVASIPILMVPVMILTRPGLVLEPFENLDWLNLGEAHWLA